MARLAPHNSYNAILGYQSLSPSLLFSSAWSLCVLWTGWCFCTVVYLCTCSVQ